MKLLMDLFEVGIGDVRIDLGGGDIAMSEHRLHAADIGAVHEQVGGEAVAQGMGADFLSNPG